MKKILHPTDFSSCAEHALGRAIELARALDAELILLHVAVEAPLYREGISDAGAIRRTFESQREWARETLEQHAVTCRSRGVPTLAVVTSGVPHEAIVATAAAEPADLIVMGTHGRGGFARWFMGSTADRVVRTAACPVLTVREPEQGGA